LLGQEAFIGSEVRHHDFGEEVRHPRDHVAGDDLRHGGEHLLVQPRVLLRVLLDPDFHEHREAEPDGLAVEQGTVAANDALRLQPLDPAQAGRRREADRLGDVDIGPAAVLLQRRDDPPVDGIERGVSHFVPLHHAWRHNQPNS
jgi:hypothetical protein